MSAPRAFPVRVRRDGNAPAVVYPITRRRGETVVQAIRRGLRGACGDPDATVERGFATFLISDAWQPAFRLAFHETAPGVWDAPHPVQADVDVPAAFPIAWL